MRWKTRMVVGLSLLLGLASAVAMALGPVDGELGAVWWDNSFDASEGGDSMSSGAGAPGFRAEVWLFKKYGVRAERYSSELDDLGGMQSDYTSLDLMWRAFSPTENNYIALGIGWQEMDLAVIGLEGDTSGARLAAEGRISLGGLFYLYGQGSYLPSLNDGAASNPLLGRFENLDGYEFEGGISCKVAPFVSLRAGYREQNVGFTRTGFEALPGEPTEIDGEAGSDGFLAGLSFRF